MKQQNEVSPSRAIGLKTIYELFKILKEEDGQLPGKQLQGLKILSIKKILTSFKTWLLLY